MPPFALPSSRKHVSASSFPSDPRSGKHQINLLRGWPSPSLLPASQIQDAAQRALSQPDVFTPGLLYGPDPGYQPLREHIASWLDGFYGPATARAFPDAYPGDGYRDIDAAAASGGGAQVGADGITITGGASQNLANILLVYSDPVKTKVWIVAPCYFMACNIFDDAGLAVGAVGDRDGADLEALERGMGGWVAEGKEALKPTMPWSKYYSNIIYCVPTFSNPSGLTMPLSTRISLVKLARKYDALIITDDVYDFLQWPSSPSTHSSSTTSTPISSTNSELKHAPLPRLIDIDITLPDAPSPFGNAVSNGSFSKIAGPGVRTGWADSTPTFAYGLSQCGASRSGGAPSQLTATIMDELLSSGDLQRHIDGVLKPSYARRYGIIVAAIKASLEPLGIKMLGGEGGEVVGGYFIWVDLPGGLDAEAVSERCKEVENLVVPPGRIFEVQGDEGVRFPGSVRLCFAWEEEEDLKEGVERLGRVVKDMLEGKGGGDGMGKVTKGDFGEFK